MLLTTNLNRKKLGDKAIIQEIGAAIKAIRLQLNLTQDQVAERAGLDRTTVVQLEKGRSATLLTLIQILRVLDKLDALDGLQAESPISPLDMANMLEKTRQRASRAPRKPKRNKAPW
jgi:transcriptional regulator with XRE-family HTH domain